MTRRFDGDLALDDLAHTTSRSPAGTRSAISMATTLSSSARMSVSVSRPIATSSLSPARAEAIMSASRAGGARGIT
jgi:hypothetical protein